MTQKHTSIISILRFLVQEYDAKLHSYSGRMMYGDKCLAVTIAPESVYEFIFNLGVEVEKAGDVHRGFELGRMSIDNMGYDNVIYWRGLGDEILKAFEETESKTDEDEEYEDEEYENEEYENEDC